MRANGFPFSWRVGLTSLCLGLSLCLSQQVSAQESIASVDRVEVPDPLDDLGSLEPEDGVWLTDDAGKEYFVKPLPKVKGTYRWLNDEQTKIGYKHWYRFTVLRHDADFLYLKLYKPTIPPVLPTREEREAQRQKDLKALAESFVPEAGESDRMEFSTFDEGLPKRGMWRNGFDIADINGDGHLDIIHGPTRKGAPTPRIFLGDGAGKWRLWTEAKFPRAPWDYGDAAVADFNGDGLLGIAFAFHLKGLIVVEQTSPGVFELATEGLDLEIPGQGGDSSGFSSREIEIVDWNQDGRPDILALGEGPRPAGTKDGRGMGMITTYAYGAVIYENLGGGKWTRRDQGLRHGGVFGDSLALGDFNHDGRQDFLTASHILNGRDVLNIGQEDLSWQTLRLEGVRRLALVQAVAAGDFNSDGRDDMALAYSSVDMKVRRVGLDVLLAQEDGSWQRHTVAAQEGRTSLWAMDSGDLDGDGNLDLVAATSKGEVWIFLGDGHGGFDRETSPEIHSPLGCRGYNVRLVDLDGDGKDELISSFAGEGSLLPLPQFPVDCKTGGEISIWKGQRKEAATS